MTATNATGAWIEITPLDDQLDGGGFASFERAFPQSTELTATAAKWHNGQLFTGWRVDGGPLIRDTSTTLVLAEEAHTLEAVYGVVVPPYCGLGAELALILPPLMWVWRRRRS